MYYGNIKIFLIKIVARIEILSTFAASKLTHRSGLFV